DNHEKAGWSLGWLSAIDSERRTIFVPGAYSTIFLNSPPLQKFSVLCASATDLRFRFFNASSSTELIFAQVGLASGPCPTIEQRRSNTQLRCHLGRAAAALTA